MPSAEAESSGRVHCKPLIALEPPKVFAAMTCEGEFCIVESGMEGKDWVREGEYQAVKTLRGAAERNSSEMLRGFALSRTVMERWGREVQRRAARAQPAVPAPMIRMSVCEETVLAERGFTRKMSTKGRKRQDIFCVDCIVW